MRYLHPLSFPKTPRFKPRNPHGRWRDARCLSLLFVLAYLAACTAMPQNEKAALDELSQQLQQVQHTLKVTEEQLSEVDKGQQSLDTSLLAQQQMVTDIQDSLQRLPKALTTLCPKPTIATANCDTEGVHRVIISGDKMVVGELEQVWIDPPGINLNARVDTGATSNSLHAEDMEEFERDGSDWVRFYISNSDEERVQVERPVQRWVRVYQQADPEGSRRPVVKVRIFLGDIQDTFEFTLADRSHLEYQMLLGRNFLTDVALVDVGRQFVQPPYHPRKSKSS